MKIIHMKGGECMAKEKMYSDEEIIAALMLHRTAAEAAKALGTTPRTIYERMRQQSFCAEYRDAKSDILRGAVLKMTDSLSAAVDAVNEIIQDGKTNPAIRLQAAQTIINNAVKLSERLALEEDINRETRNPHSIDFLEL